MALSRLYSRRWPLARTRNWVRGFDADPTCPISPQTWARTRPQPLPASAVCMQFPVLTTTRAYVVKVCQDQVWTYLHIIVLRDQTRRNQIKSLVKLEVAFQSSPLSLPKWSVERRE